MKEAQRTIDGMVVRMSPLPARMANQWLVRLSGHLAPLLGAIAGATADASKPGGFKLEDAEITEAGLSNLGGALQLVFSRLTAAEVDATFDAMLSRTTVELDGSLHEVVGQAAFDAVFTGRVVTSWKILGMSLVENYRDFFGGALGKLIAQGKAAVTRAAAKAVPTSAPV